MDGQLDWAQHYAGRAARVNASEIRELLKLLDRPDVISFAGGIPDPAMFPVDAVSQAAARLLAEAPGQALQYAPSEGYRPLREWIAAHLAGFGIAAAPDNILITAGSQQALDFFGKLFIGPGDTLLVEAPTYLGALQAFSAYEPQYQRLTVEGRNIAGADFAQFSATLPGRFAGIYVVPDFSNPTGRTIGRADRERIIDLARELDCVVVEDAAYQALRYEGEPVPPIMALDCARSGGIDNTRTIYCGTFSKTLAPALRVGWICAARPVIDKLVVMKQAADLQCATLNQMIAHSVVSQEFEARLPRLRATYRARRDRMLAALEREMPKGCSWTRPEGGMFIWVTLPEAVDSDILLARAVDAGVAFVPGRAFHADGTGRNTLRLSYSLASEAQIDQGIARLGDLVRQALG